MNVAYHQNTVAHVIATRPIMDLCLAEERPPGKRVHQRFWEQGTLDLEGMRVDARAAEISGLEEDGDGKD